MCSWRSRARRPTGIALAVKDLFDTAGLVTTYGSPLFAGHVPARLRPRSSRSRQRATASSGRRTCTSSPTGRPPRTRTSASCPNPLAPDRVAGGSSGGNAAALVLGQPTWRSGPTRAAPSASPRRAAASSASSLRTGSCRSKAAFRSRRALTTRGRWHAMLPTCEAASRCSPPDTSRSGSSRSKSSRSPSRGSSDAEPLVRARVLEAAGACTPAPLRVTPATRRSPPAVRPRGRRRAPRAHRGKRRALRRGRALQDRALPGSIRTEAERATRRREEYRDEVESALAGFDLVLTPTLPRVAPRIGEGAPGDVNVRKSLISNTFPFNTLGWPALALPCGDGGRRSSRIRAARRPARIRFARARSRKAARGIAFHIGGLLSVPLSASCDRPAHRRRLGSVGA